VDTTRRGGRPFNTIATEFLPRDGNRKIVAVIGSLTVNGPVTVNGPLTDEHAEDTRHAPIWLHDWSFLHVARVTAG